MSAGAVFGIGSVNTLPLEHSSDLTCDLLVLGASFTGIELMYQLQRRSVLASIDTIVVDSRAVHGYIPLVHELVAGEIASAKYVLPTADYVRSLPRSRYVVDTVLRLDVSQRQVTLASGRFVRARAIVVALGSSVEAPASLGLSGSAKSAKFIEQSAAIRQHLQSCPPGKLVVIGGGITGVEMAGELAMWCKRGRQGFTVTLIDSHAQLLTKSGRGASRIASKLLRQLGVEILSNTRVQAIADDHVAIATTTDGDTPSSGAGRELPCSLVVWAGGIRPALVNRELGLHRGADGFIEVDASLRCRNHSGAPLVGIFAGGDAVRVRDGSGIWPTMQRAIECIWQGKVLARNVEAFFTIPHAAGDAVAKSRELVRHTLIRDFPYGISIGSHSLVMYGPLVMNLRALGVAFRRWLMRRYFARYKPRIR